MAYSNSSEGLHRFVDPADGGVYLHATSFLDEAQRIFACFDQPDLKAPVDMRLTAPTGWTVAANAADLRWRIVHRLAVLGAVDADRIAAELAADRSASGGEWAAQARAARPDPAAKAVAWEAVINDDVLSNRLLEANGRGCSGQSRSS